MQYASRTSLSASSCAGVYLGGRACRTRAGRVGRGVTCEPDAGAAGAAVDGYDEAAVATCAAASLMRMPTSNETAARITAAASKLFIRPTRGLVGYEARVTARACPSSDC